VPDTDSLTPSGTARDIGVVIAGAGARGAYEAGLLTHLLPEVAARTQADGAVARFSFVGTSAGSLNAALIASRAPRVHPATSPEEVRRLWTEAMTGVADVWRGITERQVIDPWPSGRLLGALTRAVPLVHRPLLSVINVAPLIRLAAQPTVADWRALHERIADGTVAAVGAATTARDGRTVVFLDRHDATEPMPRDERRDIDYVDVPGGLSAVHVLASSAIPAAFPAQHVTNPPDWTGWYYDGGIRLNTPLKPALALGLDHLVVVGTHPDRYDRTTRPDPAAPPPEVDEAVVPIANQLMADQLVQDLQTLRRRNSLPESTPVRHLFAGPPDLDTLAELSRTTATGLGATRVLRSLLAGPARWELSSYLLFDPGYLGAALDAGRERAEQVLPPGSDVGWGL
jgi:NTE family protein